MNQSQPREPAPAPALKSVSVCHRLQHAYSFLRQTDLVQALVVKRRVLTSPRLVFPASGFLSFRTNSSANAFHASPSQHRQGSTRNNLLHRGIRLSLDSKPTCPTEPRTPVSEPAQKKMESLDRFPL